MNKLADLDEYFNFLKLFDSPDTFSELKKELVIDICDQFPNMVKSYNFETGEVNIEIYDFETREFVNASTCAFDEMLILINKHTRALKNKIDSNLKLLLDTNSDFTLYLKNIDQLLIALSKRKYLPFEKREVIFDSIIAIVEHLQINYNYTSNFNFKKKPFLQSIGNFNSLSYKWLALDSELGLLSLRKFYNMLSENPKIIDCSEQEFINAFTQGTVQDGIKWCILGKNGQYSKQSLLNFVDYLMSNRFVETKTSDYNKAIRYVFRDNRGQTIENVSGSKSSPTKKSSDWDRLLKIIEQI